MRKEGGGSIDRPFFFLALGILVFGLVMLASASSPVGYERFGSTYYFLQRQVLSGVLPGLAGLAFFLYVPYEIFKKYMLPLFLFSLALLVVVFIPGIGADHGTFARRWISIAGFSFQPFEIVKLTFLLFLAAWLEKKGKAISDIHEGLIPFLLILAPVCVLMLLQPDLGTLSVIGFTSFILYFVAGAPFRHMLAFGASGAVALFFLIKTSEYRAERLMTFLHPELDPLGKGYQINQALLAIGGGGILGRGYGHSLQKFQYLPEVAGDSIFAVVGEELGFMMSAVFLLTFLGFLLRGFYIADRAKDDYGKFLVIGIICWFGIQAFMNVGAMTGIVPLTGLPFPFLSHGGTALAVSLAAVGVVLNVSKGMKSK